MKEKFEDTLKESIEEYGKGGVTVVTLYGDEVYIERTADTPAGLLFDKVWVEDVGGLDELMLMIKKYGVRHLRR